MWFIQFECIMPTLYIVVVFALCKCGKCGHEIHFCIKKKIRYPKASLICIQALSGFLSGRSRGLNKRPRTIHIYRYRAEKGI